MDPGQIGEKMCELRVTDSGDMFLAKIGQVIRQNVVAIIVCLLIVSVSLLIVYVVGKMGWDVISSYKSHLEKTDLKPPPLPQPGSISSSSSSSSKKKGSVHNGDDVVFKNDLDDDSGGGLLSDIPTEPEASKLASKLAAIKSQYSAYNRAISAHVLAKGNGEKPDDLMDEGIVSRKGDDFVYSDKKRRLLHHDDGLN